MAHTQGAPMSMADADWLVSEWMARFADIMQTMADAKPMMKSSGVAEAPKGDLLWWRQPFSCSPDAPLWVGAPEQNWSALGKVVLASAGVTSPPAAEIRSTWLEIVRQSMAGLANGISSLTSIEVTCGEGNETGIEGSANKVFEIEAEIGGDPPRVIFYLAVSDALAAAISAPQKPVRTGQSGKSLSPGPSEQLAKAVESRTFELLLDVELPVSVSFGRATLRISEAMNLVSGSLIELDRALTDPVELLVNNSIIARGEVVVVEGNYGVRLTEIASRLERLQQGRRHILG
jgi:flagellar motor switch protein FliN/FliY